MKSKICLWGFAFALLFILSACKSKESAYRAAYERAQEKPTIVEEEVAPVIEPVVPEIREIQVQKEKVTTIDGSDLKVYSVVVGSFVNKTNASSLMETMRNQGYPALLVQNQQEMYRVIVLSFDDKESAAKARDQFKQKYLPDYQDAWILAQEY